MAYTPIDKGENFMNTKLYTGNGNAGNSITGVGFQPSWTWIKARGGTQFQLILVTHHLQFHQVTQMVMVTETLNMQSHQGTIHLTLKT